MKRIGKLRYWVLLLMIIYGVVLIPTPYVVYEPGSAVSVLPMVQVKEGYRMQEGDLLLTTVQLTYNTNVLKYIHALFQSNMEVYRKSSLFKQGESRAEFTQKQTYSMMHSQSGAITAAYSLLNIPYRIESTGVMVIATEEGMPAEGVLSPGDWIELADGHAVRTLQDLSEWMKPKQVGDSISLTISRDGAEKEVELVLADYRLVEPALEQPTPGLGISMSEMREIVPEDTQHQVEIAAGNIGGPSAGLMFTLQIVNQLTPEDLTHGYVIAGTGEIRENGEVTPIGGIAHKVVAAERGGAELFFMPSANADEAGRKAEEIGTDMVLVPVANVKEAVDYLKELPAKSR